jgi:hypothetical protein
MNNVGKANELTIQNKNTYIDELNKSFKVIDSLLKIIELSIKEGWDIPYNYIEEYKNARTYLGYSNEHIKL